MRTNDLHSSVWDLPSSVWDGPVSDAELTQFWGTTPSQEEIAVAIGEAASDFDSAELGDVCAIAFEQIAELIISKDDKALGAYIRFLRRQRIADMASRKVYGKVGHVFASQVVV